MTNIGDGGDAHITLGVTALDFFVGAGCWVVDAQRYLL